MTEDEVRRRSRDMLSDPRWDVPNVRVRVVEAILVSEKPLIGKLGHVLGPMFGPGEPMAKVQLDDYPHRRIGFLYGELEFVDPPGPIDYATQDEGGVV